MRPLSKWNPGENGVKAKYNPYGSAKDKLIENLGEFCSFCELGISFSGLEVEHITSQDLDRTKVNDWDNFLLGCRNCNAIKNNYPCHTDTHILPHHHNTYRAFRYPGGSPPIILEDLPAQEKTKAVAIITLAGLDRRPGHLKYSPRDKRWQYRLTTYTLAQRYLTKFEQGSADIEVITDLAIIKGFWSVWMEVFSDYAIIQTALTEAFRGTFPQYATTDINRQPL